MAVPGALVSPDALASRVPWWVTNAVVLAVCLALPGVSPLTSGLIRPVTSAEPDVADGDAEPDVSDGDVPDEEGDGEGDEDEDAEEDGDEDGDDEEESLGSGVGDGVVPVDVLGGVGAIGEGGGVGLDDEPGEEPGLELPDPAGAGSHFWLVALLSACTV